MVFPLEIKKTFSPDVRLTGVFNLLEKNGKAMGNGGIACLYRDAVLLNKSNSVVPIRCV